MFFLDRAIPAISTCARSEDGLHQVRPSAIARPDHIADLYLREAMLLVQVDQLVHRHIYIKAIYAQTSERSLDGHP